MSGFSHGNYWFATDGGKMQKVILCSLFDNFIFVTNCHPQLKKSEIKISYLFGHLSSAHKKVDDNLKSHEPHKVQLRLLYPHSLKVKKAVSNRLTGILLNLNQLK
jgi:hypothetical protein